MGRLMGAKGVQKRLGDIQRDTLKTTLAGVVEAALMVKGDSMKRTPVALGNLRASAFVNWSGGEDTRPAFKGDVAAQMNTHHDAVLQDSKPLKKEQEPEAVVGYSAVYALSVHENPRAGAGKAEAEAISQSIKAKRGRKLTMREKTTATKGEWKFLETALKSNAARIRSIIERAAKKGIK